MDQPLPQIADWPAYEAQMRAIQQQHHVAGRDCDECTVCCTIMAVGELGKKSYDPCPHCTARGCGVYQSRPTTCRGWSCEWWLGRLGLPESQRPDKLGLMFTHDADSVLVFEVFPGAAVTDEGLRVLDDVRRRYPLKFTPAGSNLSFNLQAGELHDQIAQAVQQATNQASA